MNKLFRDFGFGIRLLLKSPGFGLVATASLAIGLGASITIFCFVDSILLKPLDARDPARLVRGYGGGSDPLATVKYDDYKEYRDHNETLSSLAMFHWGGLEPVRITDTTEMIHAMPVTGNYLPRLAFPRRWVARSTPLTTRLALPPPCSSATPVGASTFIPIPT